MSSTTTSPRWPSRCGTVLRALARNESEAANAVIDESTSEIRAGTHQNVLLVLCPQRVWLLLLGVPVGEVSWTGQCHHDHGGDAPDHRQIAVADRVTDDLDISDRGTAAGICPV
jgi:hypothetical protein